jgi:hypothetical protein
MADTLTVEIPADVLDNTSRTVQVRWRDTLDIDAEQLARTRKYAYLFGYTWTSWDDFDRDGERVTLHRVTDQTGCTVELYETSYYTRVACTDCEYYCAYSWAEAFYQVTDADGIAHPAAPFCGTHGHAVERIASREPGYSVARSAWLRIGQH